MLIYYTSILLFAHTFVPGPGTLGGGASALRL